MKRLNKRMGQLAGVVLVLAAMLAIFVGSIRLARHLLGEDGLLVGVLIGGTLNALGLHGVRVLAQVVGGKAQKAKQGIEANE